MRAYYTLLAGYVECGEVRVYNGIQLFLYIGFWLFCRVREANKDIKPQSMYYESVL